MLRSLSVENIALMKRVDVDFSAGFTVLTGETGAGKTILIDSISLLLGGKGEKELIRTGEQRALVCGLFSDCTLPDALFEELNVPREEDGTVRLVRTLDADGRSGAKINGRSCPVSSLRKIGEALVNIHGQNDTRLLLDPDVHLELLDAFSDSAQFLASYREKYASLAALRREIRKLMELEENKEAEMRALRKQIEEIDGAGLRPGIEETLLQRKKLLSESETILRSAKIVESSLYKNESGTHASFLTERAAEAIDKIAFLSEEMPGFSERLRKIKYDFEEISLAVSSFLPDPEGDPEEMLNETETALETISRLKRKYGNLSTVDELITSREEAVGRLRVLEENTGSLAQKKQEFKTETAELISRAEALSANRKKGAVRLEEEVKKNLAFLDMPKVVFSVEFTKTGQYSETGGEKAEFYLSANPGEEPRPIHKIASGGELSRIMLALKNAFSESDGVGTLIFDEVDSGVSGKTAQKIGILLHSISSGSQVFCVTHSAQIASLADEHLKISKTAGERTETVLTRLDADGRVEELSRIIGGQTINETIRNTARELLAQGRELTGKADHNEK